MKNVVLLGSTGSIGRRALEILSAESNSHFRVTGLAAGENIQLLEQQILKFQPRIVSVANREDADRLHRHFSDMQFFSGASGLEQLIHAADPEVVISAISGTVSLAANLAALQKGVRLCLANKETLVAAGALVQEALNRYDGELIPVDSEHSAVFQCLQGQTRESVSRILLTASGGPFFRRSRAELVNVSLEMALNHPTWTMGRKITIDSATLMNKALELIEAAFLFQIGEDRIGVLIHPQSVVHSMVEFYDGSILAQLGIADMGIPIHYALNYPQRSFLDVESLRMERLGNLEFFAEDSMDVPSLSLARSVLRTGKSAGAVLNAANEEAVEAFIERRISFVEIFSMVEEVLSRSCFHPIRTLQDVTAAIDATRAQCREWLQRKFRS
ncbi:MAG TPA: 1-deoxy-D-xylulose-5-phosphate reductoisomerase [Candidatus Aminicenantes bacterium]|nr:1-deoxy-D-xylulose-5-phosphate reductoisomerase [Candidatus Aminicenantes bacterium]